ILHLDSSAQITDIYQDLLPKSEISNLKSQISNPQLLLDSRGLLAWIPPSQTAPGSRGAYRFVDNKWQPLGPDQNWPTSIIHLVPLLDGSVLQIIRATDLADQ